MSYKKRVGIVTYHHVNNYGSVLQAYATQETIRYLGYDSKIINYITFGNRDDQLLKTMLLDSQYAKRSLLSRTVFAAVNWIDVKNMIKVFEDFRKRRLDLTARCYTSEEVASVAQTEHFDAYCTGSDQVWNMHSSKTTQGVDSVFFLRFAPTNAYRFSIAASLGVESLSNEEATLYREYLKPYSAISVRESSSIELLRGIGIEGVAQVIDPTLLLGAERWRRVSKPAKLPETYVLVYQIHDDNSVFDVMSSLAKAMNVPIVRYSAFLRNRIKDKHIWYLPSPEQLIYGIDHAAFVITDSFHGTAFSIQLNTPFVSVTPKLFSNRITDLLSLTGLSSRMYNDRANVTDYFKTIDWSKPNSILEQKRNESMLWIGSVLNDIP